MGRCLFLIPKGHDNPVTGPVRIVDPITRLGRHPQFDLRLDSLRVSRRHAVLVYIPELQIAYYCDLVTTNGSRKWGQRVEKTELLDKEEISLGPFSFVVRFSENGELPEDEESSGQDMSRFHAGRN